MNTADGAEARQSAQTRQQSASPSGMPANDEAATRASAQAPAVARPTDSPSTASAQVSDTGAEPSPLAKFLQPFSDVLEELRAAAFHTEGYLKIDFSLLMWVFTIGSLIGLVVEIGFHYIQFGNYESRAGLVWGPFSSIYGLGAVLLTVFLNRFCHLHNFMLFVMSMIVGSCIEYFASFMMETLWGAIAWDYSGTFGNINGRTNLAFGVMWGALGLVWVRNVMPAIKQVDDALRGRHSKVLGAINIVVSVFMVANIVFTIMAFDRESQRALDIPASNPAQQLVDAWFPDEFMHQRFANMSVYGRDQLTSEMIENGTA